jgi:hypothetical protein
LNPWLQSVAFNPDWDPAKCLAVFPATPGQTDADTLQTTWNSALQQKPVIEDFINMPSPVNASTEDRLLEFMAGRSKMCLYDPQLQEEPHLHFHGKEQYGKKQLGGGRLLVHFYAFLFFQDWREDLWMKRFVRDHVRYIDEIQCAAARVVAAVRDHARKKGHADGQFDSFHIRRGDFQYKKTRVEAKEIYEISQDKIPKGSTVYVGTDERDKAFFKDMADHWDVVYLDDFMDLVQGIDKNYYGMIDQLVASRGRIFFGCWFSTFTGFINRMRGYHSDKDHLEGYEMGILDSYYYAWPSSKNAMRDFWPVKQAFYAREFPASWRDIDQGIGTTYIV